MRFSTAGALMLLVGCATTAGSDPASLSIEFGQDVYLTDEYLQSAPGGACGPADYAPGGTDVRSPLPDGSWFRLFAIESEDGRVDTVILQRGWEGGDAEVAMRLDSVEGIVRLTAPGRREAWGINHSWADWMRAIGARALALECASVR